MKKAPRQQRNRNGPETWITRQISSDDDIQPTFVMRRRKKADSQYQVSVVKPTVRTSADDEDHYEQPSVTFRPTPESTPHCRPRKYLETHFPSETVTYSEPRKIGESEEIPYCEPRRILETRDDERPYHQPWDSRGYVLPQLMEGDSKC